MDYGIFLNDDLIFNIFLNDGGISTIRTIKIDINLLKKIIGELFYLHNRSKIIREINTIEGIDSKYDAAKTQINIISQMYYNYFEETDEMFYSFEYYTYDIDGEKILTIIDHILQDQDDIIMETYYFKQLIEWPFGNTPKQLMEKNLINCLLNSIEIISTNNISNHIISKLLDIIFFCQNYSKFVRTHEEKKKYSKILSHRLPKNYDIVKFKK